MLWQKTQRVMLEQIQCLIMMMVPDVMVTVGNGVDDKQKSRSKPFQMEIRSHKACKEIKCNADEEIDVNRCCAWYNNAGIGMEWLQC